MLFPRLSCALLCKCTGILKRVPSRAKHSSHQKTEKRTVFSRPREKCRYLWSTGHFNLGKSGPETLPSACIPPANTIQKVWLPD